MAKAKYNDNFPLLAEDYAREGMIDDEIAAALGISPASYYNYQKKHIEFLEAIKKGKAPVDVEAEKALLKRVKGFEYEETQVEYINVPSKKGEKTSPKVTVIKKKNKMVIPDVAACIFWLKNRRPKRWRDNQGIEVTGEDGEPIKIEYVPVKKKEDDNKTG